jgi:hypothetical protein
VPLHACARAPPPDAALARPLAPQLTRSRLALGLADFSSQSFWSATYTAVSRGPSPQGVLTRSRPGAAAAPSRQRRSRQAWGPAARPLGGRLPRRQRRQANQRHCVCGSRLVCRGQPMPVGLRHAAQPRLYPVRSTPLTLRVCGWRPVRLPRRTSGTPRKAQWTPCWPPPCAWRRRCPGHRQRSHRAPRSLQPPSRKLRLRGRLTLLSPAPLPQRQHRLQRTPRQ